MIVAGMRMSVYWGVTFLIGLTAYFVLMAFWTVLGVITKIPLFTLIAGGPLIALFLVFAFNQVGFAFLMSTFFDVAASASRMIHFSIVDAFCFLTYLFQLLGTFGSVSINCF